MRVHYKIEGNDHQQIDLVDIANISNFISDNYLMLTQLDISLCGFKYLPQLPPNLYVLYCNGSDNDLWNSNNRLAELPELPQSLVRWGVLGII